LLAPQGWVPVIQITEIDEIDAQIGDGGMAAKFLLRQVPHRSRGRR
jgi:hypothetical protein